MSSFKNFISLKLVLCFVLIYNSSFSQPEINEGIISKSPTTVFIFLSPECPLCQGYSLTITRLYSKYESENIKFYGIVSGKNYSADQVKKYTQEYKINMSVKIDTGYTISRKFKANITPEVVVLNNKSEVLYKGAIDNWVYSLGRKRKNITRHYLEDALGSIVGGSAIKEANTQAFGCFIE